MKNKRTFFSITGSIIAGFLLLFLTSFRDGDFQLVKSIDVFCAVFKQVVQGYADEIDPEKLVLSGIEAMLNSLDPYTNYFTENDAKTLKQMHTGKYAGVGATILQFDNKTFVADIMEGCPAQLSGLQSGDIIMAVDSVKIEKQNVTEIGKLLKGDAKTFVDVTVNRNGTIQHIRIKRDNITIPNVPYYGLAADSIGYIKLTNFSGNASKDVKTALKELKKQKKITGVILDLRDNPGGLLVEAVDIVNLFVDKGKTIVSLKKRNTVKIFEYKTTHDATDAKIPLVVIVNKNSASASEVVSGAIQDLDRGVILGQKSYGKGLVQTEMPMPYNSFLNLTTSKYYIPSGRCIQAIDYFHKGTDGTAPKVADSLRKAFKTVNGRIVYDGGGINPDMAVREDTLNNFVKTLLIKNMIFQYATRYAYAHDKIVDARSFEITAAILKDFENFLNEKKFSYSEVAEKNIEELTKYFIGNKNLDDVKGELETIKKHIGSNNAVLISENKDIISTLLRSEICSRYYYIKGHIEASLTTDSEVLSAVRLLKNRAQYTTTLGER